MIVRTYYRRLLTVQSQFSEYDVKIFKHLFAPDTVQDASVRCGTMYRVLSMYVHKYDLEVGSRTFGVRLGVCINCNGSTTVPGTRYSVTGTVDL